MRMRSGVGAAVLAGLLTPASSAAGTLVFSAPACEGRCVNVVWRMEDDGSDPRKLTDPRSRFDDGIGAPSGIDVNPTWSPDGSRIGFVRMGADPREEDGLWVVNADGSDPRYVYDVWGLDDWSPDGEQILFSGY